jgi:methyltransferase (TIGR00027 family)
MRQGRPSSTAENVALARAHLTTLGVLDDFHAHLFVGGWKRVIFRTGAGRRGRIGSRVRSWIAARTRFYDGVVTDALDAGIRRVAILAAGYDTRAWRFAREGVQFIEVDHPDTQRRKRALAPPGGPLFLAADLAKRSLDEVFAECGVIFEEPAVFICEGLTPYLREHEVKSMFTQLARLGGSGSRLGTDFASPPSDTRRAPLVFRFAAAAGGALAAFGGEPIRFKLAATNVREFLLETGWIATDVARGFELHARLLGDTDFPPPPPGGPCLVAATTL